MFKREIDVTITVNGIYQTTYKSHNIPSKGDKICTKGNLYYIVVQRIFSCTNSSVVLECKIDYKK